MYLSSHKSFIITPIVTRPNRRHPDRPYVQSFEDGRVSTLSDPVRPLKEYERQAVATSSNRAATMSIY